MGFHTKSPDRVTHEEEANIGVDNQPRETTSTSLNRSQIITTRNWWICIFVCSGLVVAGRILSMLLLNFYYIQTGRDVCDDPKQFKGTWLQSMVQNAAFPFTAFLLLLWRSSFSTHSETSSSSSCSSSFGKLFLLYISLGVLFAAYSQLYAIGRTHCVFFFWIFTSQLIFTSIFTTIINKQKFNRWIILSMVLSGAATGLGITSSGGAYIPCENEGSKMSNGAWCAFFGTVAFSLSLCIMQLGFQKVIPTTQSRVSAVILMQTNASMIATLICLVGLFVSGEFKDIKEDFETFKKGKPLYVLSLIGLSLAWQVMSLGLVGLVCLASSLFSNVVSFCSTPLVNILLVLAFRFTDADVKFFKEGALVAGILGFASYVYSLYKSTKKKEIASQSQTTRV
ncbi:putative purine permease, plant [Arabidopsis thaliana]